jgi:hypothetical protein
MAELRVTKAAVTPEAAAFSQTAKAAPSKFDLIRSQITEKVAASTKLPPLMQLSAQQISAVEKGLKQQLERSTARSAAECFRGRTSSTQSGMDRLASAVGKPSPDGAFSGLRDRMKDLEQQFQRSGDLIQGATDMDPKSLLNVQMQLYQLSGNIEVMSRLVEQVSSGVKTMLQVQV